MSRYEVFTGRFPCHTCKEEVKSLRMYLDTGEIAWLCSQKHLSTVNLKAQKKTKKDYERKI